MEDEDAEMARAVAKSEEEYEKRVTELSRPRQQGPPSGSSSSSSSSSSRGELL